VPDVGSLEALLVNARTPDPFTAAIRMEGWIYGEGSTERR